MKIYKIIKIFSDQATSPIRRGGIRTMSQFFCKTAGGLERGRDYLRYRLRKQRLFCRVASVIRIGAVSYDFENKDGIKQNKKTHKQTNEETTHGAN